MATNELTISQELLAQISKPQQPNQFGFQQQVLGVSTSKEDQPTSQHLELSDETFTKIGEWKNDEIQRLNEIFNECVDMNLKDDNSLAYLDLYNQVLEKHPIGLLIGLYEHKYPDIFKNQALRSQLGAFMSLVVTYPISELKNIVSAHSSIRASGTPFRSIKLFSFDDLADTDSEEEVEEKQEPKKRKLEHGFYALPNSKKYTQYLELGEYIKILPPSYFMMMFMSINNGNIPIYNPSKDRENIPGVTINLSKAVFCPSVVTKQKSYYRSNSPVPFLKPLFGMISKTSFNVDAGFEGKPVKQCEQMVGASQLISSFSVAHLMSTVFIHFKDQYLNAKYYYSKNLFLADTEEEIEKCQVLMSSLEKEVKKKAREMKRLKESV